MLVDYSDSLLMTPSERNQATVLVVEADPNDRNNMRTALKNLGYGGICDAPNHTQALERFTQRRITHIIFDAKKTTMPAADFLKQVFEFSPKIVAIPSSANPNVDDVFNLLVLGARGYLVKPFTMDTVEEAILMATKGEPIAEAVLHAKDRNEALVAIIMGALDKVAVILRQAQKFETAQRELPRMLANLGRAVELAHTFAKDGEEGLQLALEKFCIERSKGPASRLGRLRKRLRSSRGKDDEGNDTPSAV